MGHHLAELGTVQFFLPAADNDGGDTISDHIGEGATFSHKCDDADEKCQRLNRNGRDGGEDGGEGDEPGAGDAGSAFGGDHGEKKDAHHLPRMELGIRRLREEDCGEGEIDVGAVSVEAVASGKDQGDDGARGTEALQLLHHVREDRFGGAGAEDDEEFVLNMGDEAKNRKAGEMRNSTKNDDDEDQAAERAERGGADDDTDDVENDFAKDDDAAGERIASSAEQRDGKAGKNGDEQDLENVAGGEGVNEGARDGGEQEGDDTGLLDSAGIAGGRFGIE